MDVSDVYRVSEGLKFTLVEARLDRNDDELDFDEQLMRDAIKDAISLVDMRKPEKVRFSHRLVTGLAVCKCPNCSEPLCRGWDFCPKCGKAVYWNE